jgi:antitoxin CcdA
MPVKARTNVSLDADLLRQARELGINLSAVLEDQLRDLVAASHRQRWLTKNRPAIADANSFLIRYGLWSDGHRQF